MIMKADECKAKGLTRACGTELFLHKQASFLQRHGYLHMYLSTYCDRNRIIIINAERADYFQQIDTYNTGYSLMYCTHKKIY